MTNPTPTTAIIRATDDGGFGSEYRIRDGLTESRSTMNGESLGDWTPAYEFSDRKTIGRTFRAPRDLDEIAHVLRAKIGTPGNWTNVEIVTADPEARA